MASSALPTYTRRLLLTGGTGMLALRIVGTPGAYAQATPAVTTRPILISPEALDAGGATTGRTIVAVTSSEDYVAGHIRGARSVDWPAFELSDSSTDDALEAWSASAAATLGELGLHNGSDIVAYDGGTVFACRLGWVLAYLGGETSQMLDGGLPAWAAAGLAMDRGAPGEVARAKYRLAVDASQLATLPAAVDAVGQPGVAFVDARSADEYARGHIPGAINIPYLMNVRSGNVPTWLPASARSALYLDLGVSRETLVIPYCSTGVRSSVTWFSLRELGYPRVSLFSGSWAEWSAHAGLPVTTGPTP